MSIQNINSDISNKFEIINSKNNSEPNRISITLNDINQYNIISKIGEGTFSEVKLATHKLTNEKVAIKILDKKYLLSKKISINRIKSEISIFKQLKHQNIVKLLSLIETKEKIFIIQEYIKGPDLFEYIQENHLTEKESCKIFQQLISTIYYLHNLGIVHRDLKAENILLTENKDIKIIDFGLSKICKNGELLNTRCGTLYCSPPEILLGKKYDGKFSDIWSCGVILYFMLCDYLPFNELNKKELYNKIIKCKYNKISENISNEAKDLISNILVLNPQKRLKIEQIIKHPWFNIIYFSIIKGININEIKIPIDEEIVEQMNNIGFDKNEVRITISKNLFNNISCSYYLLLQKKIKSGHKSVADYRSILFKQYIENENNKIIKRNNVNNMNDSDIKNKSFDKRNFNIIDIKKINLSVDKDYLRKEGKNRNIKKMNDNKNFVGYNHNITSTSKNSEKSPFNNKLLTSIEQYSAKKKNYESIKVSKKKEGNITSLMKTVNNDKSIKYIFNKTLKVDHILGNYLYNCTKKSIKNKLFIKNDSDTPNIKKNNKTCIVNNKQNENELSNNLKKKILFKRNIKIKTEMNNNNNIKVNNCSTICNKLFKKRNIIKIENRSRSKRKNKLITNEIILENLKYKKLNLLNRKKYNGYSKDVLINKIPNICLSQVTVQKNLNSIHKSKKSKINVNSKSFDNISKVVAKKDKRCNKKKDCFKLY